MGKLHPLIVHLPIGILLLNAVFVFLSKTKKYEGLSVALPLTLLLGALSAVAACVTGWLLSENGGYDDDILGYHKWLGIAVAAAALLLYFFKQHDNKWAWIALIAGLSATGHFGGTLTHGENYLFSEEKVAYNEDKTLLSNIQEARVYADLIVPVLKRNCYNCHNNAKQKGKLRMDEKAAFLKGGENGAIVVAGQAAHSEMIKRLLLDVDDKHHMPPKGKTQPTPQDIALLRWWIDKGLDFDKKVKEIEQTEEIKALFANFGTVETKKENPFVPKQPVEKADEKLMEAVKKTGIVLMPVAPQSPYLQANFVSIPKAGDKEVELLVPFAKQLIWLKLGGTKISDSALVSVGKLTQLTKLSLDNTRITNTGLSALSSLTHLQYLNLVGTDITTEGLTPLSILPNLKQVFIFKTPISPDALAQLKQKMPQTVFDTGGYIVPFWASDTTVFKKVK